MFGLDKSWWDRYAHDVRAQFRGEAWTTNRKVARVHGVRLAHWAGDEGLPRPKRTPAISTGKNSGYSIVSLAVALGAQRVVLLAFDCGSTDGRSHWHGDHPAGLGNGTAEKYAEWRAAFERMARIAHARGVEIVNASRRTTLTAFRRIALADRLKD